MYVFGSAQEECNERLGVMEEKWEFWGEKGFIAWRSGF